MRSERLDSPTSGLKDIEYNLISHLLGLYIGEPGDLYKVMASNRKVITGTRVSALHCWR